MPFDSNNNSYDQYNVASEYIRNAQQPVFHNGYRPQSEIMRMEEAMNNAKSGSGQYRDMRHRHIKKAIFDDDDYDSDGELTGRGMKNMLKHIRILSKRRNHEDSDSDDDSDSDNDYDSDGEMTGRGLRKTLKRFGRQIKKKLKDTERKLNKSAIGRLAVKGAYMVGDEIKKSAIDKDGYIRQNVTGFLDQAPGQIAQGAQAAVMGVTGNPVAAQMAGEIVEAGVQEGREKLREKTGYGKKLNMPKLTEKYVKNTVVKRENPRNAIVKQVMEEQGLSMPKASAYVKKHNLY